jgi:hypothetical protein
MLKNIMNLLFKKFTLTLFLFLLQICSMAAPAQDLQPQSEGNPVWVNLGLGLGSRIYFDTSFSFAGVVNGTYQTGNQIICVRGAANVALMDAAVSDMGILYGRVIKNSSHYLSLAAGIAVVRYEDDGKKLERFGIPFELQFFFRRRSHLGLYGFANINSRKTFFGLCLCLRIGRLKR